MRAVPRCERVLSVTRRAADAGRQAGRAGPCLRPRRRQRCSWSRTGQALCTTRTATRACLARRRARWPTSHRALERRGVAVTVNGARRSITRIAGSLVLCRRGRPCGAHEIFEQEIAAVIAGVVDLRASPSRRARERSARRAASYQLIFASFHGPCRHDRPLGCFTGRPPDRGIIPSGGRGET